MRNGQHGNFASNVFPGAKFGMLTVIGKLPREPKSNDRKGFKYKTLCLCDCGRVATPETCSLPNGLTKSCGCNRLIAVKKRARELSRTAPGTGQVVPGARFGRLIVIERPEVNGVLSESIHCKCDCGNETRSGIDSLVNGLTRSCGCLQSELLVARNKKNAKYGSFKNENKKTYSVWFGVKNRCRNPNCASFAKYGGSGIKMCEYLAADPRNLVAVVGLRPSPEQSLDRFPDCKGGYTCGDCFDCIENDWKLNIRWADAAQQGKNKITTVWLEAFGLKLHKAEWIRRSGLSESTVNNRLNRGWTIEKALTTPDKRGNCYCPSAT